MKIVNIDTLSAVVVGGLITTFTQLVLNWYKNKQTARQVALAFKGEIESLLVIIKKRNYIEFLEKAIKECQVFFFKVTFDYFKIYERNADKIGLLKGTLPQKIAIFYTQLCAILEDVKDIFNIQEKQKSITPEEMEEIMERQKEMLKLARDTINVGKDILKTIDEIYS